MRELRSLARAERTFFEVKPIEEPRWAELAADAGYADQSHLCRESRRVTGFSPAELHRRILQEEGFWAYRLWSGTAPEAQGPRVGRIKPAAPASEPPPVSSGST
jgi:AraC-like DNA-binding protein